MASVVPTADLGLAQRLSAGLEAVEAALLANVSTPDAYINAAASHLAHAGGKRFRPMLALLAAQFGDPDTPGVIEVATVVELTHLATLYHDDVMDEAALRRGSPSANARFGNNVAILTGDFLFARASLLLSTLSTQLVRIQALTMERLVAGQIHETQGPGAGADPVAHYLSVAGDKTASLVAASARMGAVVAGAPSAVVETLTQFGERIGLAFQLADDLLDIVSDSPQWGKTPGTDLREGVASLPLVLARFEGGCAGVGGAGQLDTAERQELSELIGQDLTEDAAHARALALLRRSSAVQATRQRMLALAEQARAMLAELPEGAATAALADVCDHVVSRTA